MIKLKKKNIRKEDIIGYKLKLQNIIELWWWKEETDKIILFFSIYFIYNKKKKKKTDNYYNIWDKRRDELKKN